MEGSVNLAAAQQLAEQLGHASFEWPIALTPKSPFRPGVAALVFVSPHVLSPADDVADFGYLVPWAPPIDEPPPQGLPHDGAHVVAWLRPPELKREYSVEFSCTGVPSSTFVLDQESGGQETKVVTGGTKGNFEVPIHVPTTFHAGEADWTWFSLSASNHWKLESCEISILP